MQSVIPDYRLQDVRTRLLEEIKATEKRIHRDLHLSIVPTREGDYNVTYHFSEMFNKLEVLCHRNNV